MKKFSKFLMVFSLVCLSGCASIVEGDEQLVSVQTKPAGAKCTLKNNEGTFLSNKTPSEVSVDTTCGNMHVTCEKEGYKPTKQVVEDSHRSIVWGNILIGGLVGYLVDRQTGAACEYPKTVLVDLEKR